MKKFLAAALFGLCAVSANASYADADELNVYISGVEDLRYFSWLFHGHVGNDGNMHVGRGLGGEIFGKYVYLDVYYQPRTYIDTFIVTATDNIGDTQSADLELWVNDAFHSKQNCPTREGNVVFHVNKSDVYRIQIRSVHKSGRASGEESLIKRIQSNGRPSSLKDVSTDAEQSLDANAQQ